MINFITLFSANFAVTFRHKGASSNNSTARTDVVISNPGKVQRNKFQMVRAVTAFYPPYVTEVAPPYPNRRNKCGNAKECYIPDKSNGTTQWRKGCCTGYNIEMFEKVRERLNFDYTLYLAEDGKWGTEENGTWNGMIGAAAYDKADVIVNTLTALKKRAEVVDFSHHFMESAFGILRIEEYNKDFPNWQFLKPLSYSLEIALLVATFLTLFIISAIEKGSTHMRRKPTILFQETMAYVFGLSFQRDMGGTNPRMWSGRLTALGYASAMTIIMSIYTARITANSIGHVVIEDFKGFSDGKVCKNHFGAF